PTTVPSPSIRTSPRPNGKPPSATSHLANSSKAGPSSNPAENFLSGPNPISTNPNGPAPTSPANTSFSGPSKASATPSSSSATPPSSQPAAHTSTSAASRPS